MLFNIIVIILVGVIAYFHYVQGLFSAGISLILATVSALLALGYTEAIVDMALRGKMTEQSYALVTVAVFALSYLILRTIFDAAVPGNMRFPVLVDKIGAGVMGLLAGLLAMGVFVVAIQSLPFTTSIGGYERYPMTYDKPADVLITGRSSAVDAKYDEVDKEKFLLNVPGDAQRLWVPVDDLALGLLYRTSDDTGALSNGRPFEATHPDYLQELFGQRLGYQVGSKHTAVPDRTKLLGIYAHNEFGQTDQERFEKSGTSVGCRGKNVKPTPEPLPLKRTATKGRLFLIVRVQTHRDDSDPSTNMVSFSPAAIRLVTRSRDGDKFKIKNNFPIGTLEAGSTLYVNTPDDFIFVPVDQAFDVVFDVEEAEVLAKADAPEADRRIAPGVFLELKRLVRLSLADQSVPDISKAPRDQKTEVNRKEGIPPGGSQAGGGIASGMGGTVVKSPLSWDSNNDIVYSNTFFTSIDTGAAGSNDKNGEVPGVKFSLQEGRFSKLEAEPVRTLAIMGQGQNLVKMLWMPSDARIIQIKGQPRADIADKWAWASAIEQFSVVDTAGKRYPANGVLAKIKNGSGQDMLVGAYDATKPASSLSPVKDMRPTTVSLFFVVPGNVQLKSVDFKDTPVELLLK